MRRGLRRRRYGLDEGVGECMGRALLGFGCSRSAECCKLLTAISILCVVE